MRRSLVATATALSLAVLVGAPACGNGNGDGGATATTTTASTSTSTTAAPRPSTTTTVDATTSTTGTTVPADDPGEGEGIGDLELLAPQLLITPEELAPGLEPRGFTPGDTGPCGLADAAVVVGTAVGDADGTVVQELRVHDSPDEAMAAFEGRTCAGEDATERIGGDAAVMVETDAGLVVIAVVADAVTVVSFTGEPPADPPDVAAFAVGKILAALGR